MTIDTDTTADSIAQVQSQLATIDRIEAGFAALAKAYPSDLAIDVTTTKGYKEAVAARAAWREPRIATEKARKDAKAPVLKLGREIDARAAALTQRLVEGESNYDDQIKVEEARREQEKARLANIELERVSALHVRISELRGAVAVVNSYTSTSTEIQQHIVDLVAVPVDVSFQELQPLAEIAKNETLAALRRMHTEAVAREVEAARAAQEREELAKLRAEQEKRDQAERERAENEQRAERARLAEERAELDRQQAAARAEQQRIEEEARALRARQDEQAAAERRRADEAAAAERAEADRLAREERAATQAKLDAEAAALRRQHAEAEEAHRLELARQRQEDLAAGAAAARVRDAAPQLLSALKVMVQKASKQNWNDQYPEELATARAAIDAAEGVELEDVPY